MPFTTRRNMCINPSFEVNTTGWTPWYGTGGAGTLTRMTDGGVLSTNYARLAFTTAPSSGSGVINTIGSDTALPFIESQYTHSIYIKPSQALSMYIQVQYYKNGTPTRLATGPVVVALSAGVWNRLTGIVSSPLNGENKADIRFYVSSINNGQITTATTIDFDACLFEIGSSINDFFDGSSSRDGYRYAWTGTVAGSESTEEKISDSVYRRNTVRNPKLRGNNTDWLVATGTGPGVATNTRMTDGTLTIPETGQVISTYQRIAWTTAPTDLVSCGTLFGNPGIDAVTVNGGQPHTFSIYTRTSHGDRTVQFVLTFHDSAGTQVGGAVVGPTFAIGGSNFVRVTFITTPPIGAVRSYVRLYPASGTNYINGDTIDATAFLVEQTDTVKPYFDGDTVPASLTERYNWLNIGNPTQSQSNQASGTLARKNKIVDPRIITATNWVGITAVTGAITASGFYSANIFAVPGETWTASCDITAPAGQAVTGSISARGTVGAAFGALPSTPTNFTVPAGQTLRVSNTSVIPAGADGLRLYVTSNIFDGSAKAMNFVAEEQTNRGTFFDGSTPAANGYSYQWVGTPDASESIEINTSPETRRNIAPNPSVLGPGYWNTNAGGGTLAATTPTIPDGVTGKVTFRATWSVLATSDTAGIYCGSGSARLVPAREGQTLSASIYARCNRNQNMFLFWYAYDAANALKSTANGPAFALTANQWTRLTVANFKLPATTDHLIIAAYSGPGTGFSRWAPGDYLEVQGLLLENSDVVGTYFDGDGPSTSLATTRWMGTPYGSDSVLSAGSGSATRVDNIFASLVAAGYYSPPAFSSVADMERRRLLSKLGLSEPQKLSMADLYVLAGEKNRLPAFRK